MHLLSYLMLSSKKEFRIHLEQGQVRIVSPDISTTALCNIRNRIISFLCQVLIDDETDSDMTVDHDRVYEMSASCFLEWNNSLGIMNETSGLEHKLRVI